MRLGAKTVITLPAKNNAQAHCNPRQYYVNVATKHKSYSRLVHFNDIKASHVHSYTPVYQNFQHHNYGYHRH